MLSSAVNSTLRARGLFSASGLTAPARRTLATSSMRSTSHMVDPDKAAQELEEGKQKSINGQADNLLKNAPGWDQTVASESEAIIKAEHSEGTPETLVKETVEKMSKETSQGKVTQTRVTAEKTTVQ